IVTGTEGGGHQSYEKVSSLVLLQQVMKKHPDLPVIACGGFATGEGLAAALSLGAGAVAMGSRFIASEESEFSKEYKMIPTSSKAQDTLLVTGALGPIRLWRNEYSLHHGLITDKKAKMAEEVMEDALVLKQMGCIVRVITDVGIKELPENVIEVRDAGIEVIEKMEIIEAVSNSEGMIQKIICKSTEPESEDIDEIKEFELSCLFIISHISSNSIFKKAGVVLDDTRNIKVDDEQKTNIEGVYAAGDCTGGLFQVVFAAAEGARAGINACKYLRQLKKE
ncbi:unnamed protein product, partial [marine sediment metagenome]